MREVTIYEADDGAKFDHKADCEAYEAAAADRERVQKWIASLPTEGDDAVSGRAATRIFNDVMRFLAWEREQRGGAVAEAAE